MWQIVTYTLVEAKLKPYTACYILTVLENEKGDRQIAQLDPQYADKAAIGVKGDIKKTIGPLGEINRFIPYDGDEKGHETGKDVSIKKVGIVGTGIVGVQLAQLVAMQGFQTVLKSRDAGKLDSVIQKIEKRLMKYMSAEDKDKVIGNITFTSGFDELEDADLIIECIIEDVFEKAELFKHLEHICSQKTVFATNTSSLPVNLIASQLRNPQRLVGIHFFNPIERMRLVEIVSGEKTSKKTADVAVNFTKQLYKIPVMMKDSPGGIVNRLLFLMINEAGYMMEQGIAVEDIDRAMEMGANYPMGPLRLADVVGIDITYEIIKNLADLYEHYKKPAPVFKRLIGEGRLGIKAGEGFYNYQEK